jgi:hypothetical protein
MLEWVSKVWCSAAHRRAMWPMAGHYLCAQCLRAYPVCWEMPSVAAHLGPIPRGRLAFALSAGTREISAAIPARVTFSLPDCGPKADDCRFD